MKRFIKWFCQWVSALEKEEKIGFAMGAIIAIWVSMVLFVSIDKVPATTFDYDSMEKQVIAIQQNPDLLYKTDGNITINNGIVTVKLRNDECSLTAQYNQNFELLSIQKEDNYMNGWGALVLSIALGIVVYDVSSLILTLLIYVFEELCKWIFKKIKAKTNSK